MCVIIYLDMMDAIPCVIALGKRHCHKHGVIYYSKWTMFNKIYIYEELSYSSNMSLKPQLLITEANTIAYHALKHNRVDSHTTVCQLNIFFYLIHPPSIGICLSYIVYFTQRVWSNNPLHRAVDLALSLQGYLWSMQEAIDTLWQ